MLALNIAHFPKNLASESHRAFGASPEAASFLAVNSSE
jgi:hypothetical protein